MLITLSLHTAISQSVAEVKLTSVVALGTKSHKFNFNFLDYALKCFRDCFLIIKSTLQPDTPITEVTERSGVN